MKMQFLIFLLLVAFGFSQAQVRDQRVIYRSESPTATRYRFHGFHERDGGIENIRNFFDFNPISTCYAGHYIFYNNAMYQGNADYMYGRNETTNCQTWPSPKLSHRMVGDYKNFESPSLLVFANLNYQDGMFQEFKADYPQVNNINLGSLVLTGENSEVTVFNGMSFTGSAFCIRNIPGELGGGVPDFSSAIGGIPFVLRSLRFGCQGKMAVVQTKSSP